MTQISSKLVTLGAINGFLAVALGAFGAHGLKNIASPQQLSWFATGTDYHMAHALAILLCAAISMQMQSKQLLRCAYLFQAGIIIFSGTLYMMALGAPTWLGAVTPIGGSLLLLAWGYLAWHAWFSNNAP